MSGVSASVNEVKENTPKTAKVMMNAASLSGRMSRGNGKMKSFMIFLLSPKLRWGCKSIYYSIQCARDRNERVAVTISFLLPKSVINVAHSDNPAGS